MVKIHGIEIEGKDIKAIGKGISKFFKKKRDKTNTSILFIDDNEFPIVKNLKKAGWAVEKVNDIINIDDEVVKRSQIIFIDNKGVGKTLAKKEEGLGLARIIKKTYGDKKRVILYSGYTIHVKSNLKWVDNYLEKEADTFQFEMMIRDELEKLK